MAGPYYWVGGSGNWSDATNHWSTSSGGAPNAANVPTSADDVHFNANSNTTAYTVTIDATANCRDLMFDAAPSVSGTVTWAGSAALNVYGSMTLLSGMTASYTGALTFAATSTGKTVTTNGVTLISNNSLAFNGIGGGWTLGSNAIFSNDFNLSAGTFDTGGYALSVKRLKTGTSSTKVLNLNNSTVTITVPNPADEEIRLDASGLTVNAGTSTIAIQNRVYTLNFGGHALYNITMIQPWGTESTITPPSTCNNFTITNINTTDGVISLAGNLTVTGTFTAQAGSPTSNSLLIQSNTVGTARTINAAAVSLSYVNFADITGAGAATWSGTSLGDCLGNSGITFTPSVTQYWYTPTTGTKTWSTAGNWFLGSGGTGGAGRVPLPQDDVVFDASSIGAASTTISIDMPRVGKSITFTGVTNSPSLTTASGKLAFYGSLTLASGLGISNITPIEFWARSSVTFTMAGVLLNQVSGINLYGPGGTVTMQDALACGNSGGGNDGLRITVGATFNANNFNVTLGGRLRVTHASAVVNMGSGTWTFVDYNDTVSVTAGTINAGTSTIKLTNTSSNAKYFFGAGKTYNDLWIAPGSGTGTFNIAGSNTFNQFKDTGTAAHSILFTAGTTQTIADWQVSGSAGNLITIGSITAASHTLTTGASGYREGRYLSISRSTATPASKWYAGRSGTESVDGGNNSGWIFLHAPTVVSYSATVAMAGAMIRQIAKAFTSATAMAASMLRGRFREFVASATLTASMVRSLAIVRAVTVTTSAARDLWKWTTNNAFITKFRSTVFGVGRRS